MGELKKIELTFGENKSTPTVLTVDWINKIVKTIVDSNIQTIYSGFVTCDTAIPASKAFVLERNGITYLGNKTLDQYSIRSSKSTIIEGESFEILSNDIEISSLVFSVKQANITSGGITESELINAISISGNKVTFNKLNRKVNVVGSLVIESNTIYSPDNKKTVTVLINSTHINTIVAQYDKYTFNPSIDLLNFDRVGSQTITLYPSNSSTIPLLDITASFEQNTTRYSIISKTQSSITISCLDFNEREPNAVIITAKDALGYTVGDIAVNIDNRIPTDVSITGSDSFEAVMGQGSADYLFSYNPATHNVSVELVSISATNSVSVTNKSVNGFTLSVTGKTSTISTTVTAKFKIDDKEVTVTKDVLIQYLDFIYPLVLINPTDEVIEFRLVKTGTLNNKTIRYKAVTDYEYGMYDTYDWSKVKMLKHTISDNTTYRINPHNQFFISCDENTASNTLNYWHFDIQLSGLILDGDVTAMCGGTLEGGSDKAYALCGLFHGCTGITNAPKLSSTTLTSFCYTNMFSGCTNLITAPELPATTLTMCCYKTMFYNCTSLTTAPELPATELIDNCYNSMFRGCTSLTVAPKLPATTLAKGCYQQMFYNCSSLINAPELLSPILVQSCYYAMFYGCTKLNRIKMLATNISATQCLDSWVYQTSSGGTFVKHKDITIVSGSNGIPNGWTIVDATAYFELPSSLIAKNGNGSFEFTFHDAYKGRVTAISTNNANVVLNSLNDNKFSLNVNGIALDTTVNVNLTIDGIVYTCSVVFTYKLIFNEFKVYANSAWVVPNSNIEVKVGDIPTTYIGDGIWMVDDTLVDESTDIIAGDVVLGKYGKQEYSDGSEKEVKTYSHSLAKFENLQIFEREDGTPYIIDWNRDNYTNPSIHGNPLEGGFKLKDGYTIDFLGQVVNSSWHKMLVKAGVDKAYSQYTNHTIELYSKGVLVQTFNGRNPSPYNISFDISSALPDQVLDSDCIIRSNSRIYIGFNVENQYLDEWFFNLTKTSKNPLTPDLSLPSTSLKAKNGTLDELITPDTPNGGVVSVTSVSSSNSAITAAIVDGKIKLTGTIADGSPQTGTLNIQYTVNGYSRSVGVEVTATYADALTPLIIMNTTGSAQTFGYKMGAGASQFEIATMQGHVKGAEDYGDVQFTTVDLTTTQVNVTLQDGESFLIQSRTHVPSDSKYLQFVITKFAPEFDGDVLGTCGCKMGMYVCNCMFRDCTSLTVAPELPATTLADYCYRQMFRGCTSLTVAPELPATTLADYCYNQMFLNCTSLTVAPELPATELANYCYSYVFYGCAKLNYIKALFTITPTSLYTNNWLNGVSASGTFVKNAAATWDVTGTFGVPSGWTVEYASE